MDPGAESSPGALSVAHIGAFSMPNWGDKLYPGTLASLLDEVGLSTRRAHFAPVDGTTSAGEPIRRLRHIRDSDADVAFAGGGDILRFDDRTVALDHLSVPTSRRGSRVERLRARAFAHRHFLPGPGAWAPQERWLEGKPSVLISAGVHTVPDREEARRAVRNYDAAWVRTEHGVDRLVGAGIPEQRVVRGPDMIFALPDLDRQDAVRERGRSLLATRVGSDAPVVLFHAAEFHGWPAARVAAALDALAGVPRATLSLGSYAGEHRLLASAAVPRGIPTLHDLDADDITATLAGAGAVFTTSMHAAIVAASFGTPVLVPSVGKTRDAFAVCPEPPTLHEVGDATLRTSVDALLGERITHSTAANRAAVVATFVDTLQAAKLV